jgi:hypothetical protein
LRTWEWKKKLFFHLLDPTVLDSNIILTFCVSKSDHKKLNATSVQNLLEMRARDPQPEFSQPKAQKPIKLLILKLHTLYLANIRTMPAVLCMFSEKERTTKISMLKKQIWLVYRLVSFGFSLQKSTFKWNFCYKIGRNTYWNISTVHFDLNILYLIYFRNL